MPRRKKIAIKAKKRETAFCQINGQPCQVIRQQTGATRRQHANY